MPTRRITRVSIACRLAVLGTLAVMVHGALAAAVGRAQVCAGDVGADGSRERIDGVISETRDVAGKRYARISVGSDDAVRAKMRLNVVSRRGEVLGHLIVTAVEPEEAIGVLSGPRVNEIGPDDTVTNQPAGKADDGRGELVNS